MDKKVQVTLIGVGCMGEAMVRGLLQRKGQFEIVGIEPVGSRIADLMSRYPTASFREQLADSAINTDVIVLCVKPQQLKEAAELVKGRLQPNTLVISILAGVSLEILCQSLQHQNVVRAMPNTPGQMGRGYTGWCPSAGMSDPHLVLAENVLGSLGRQRLYLKEELLDTVTAISGSGPGTFAYLIQAYIEAGVKNGMTRADAREAVLQTVLGTADYLLQTGDHPAILQDSVTSPGGTTAAIVYELDKAGVRAAVATSIDAGIIRCRQLRQT